MAFRTYLQGLGATHLFDLDNNGTLTTDDLGSSSTPTNISGGTYTFDTDPVCEGVTHSLDVVANTSAGTDGAVFTNVSGINTGITGWNTDKRSLLIWCKQSDIQNPTCIYEQGGGVNNFAFMGGALTTFQAADQGQPFLIVQSKSLTQSDRPYCLVGVWEYHTQHAGSGNRVLFYINGILQGISELTGTDSFPNHAGDITCGNSGENLQSFAGTVFTSQTTEKNCNFLGMFNNVSLTQAQCREIFERSTFADVTIAADTVANMQAALDALSGNTYENTNCAIRILQATDATNFRLFIDNITFNADSNLEDISIQFVGTGTLTVEDTNGTVIQYTSTPAEVETTSTTYTGGGSIVVVNNTIRRTSDDTITDSTATKLVFDGSGTTYTVSGGTISEFENVSGSAVTVNLTNGAPVPTLTETNGSITLVQNVNITAANIIDDSRVRLYNVTKAAELDNSLVSGGSGYSYSVNLQSASVDDGDTISLTATYQSGTSAKLCLQLTGVISASGLTFINSQEDDTVYNANGIDGSTVTEFTEDFPNVHIDINDGDGTTTIQRLYAWFVYITTTSSGIEWCDGIFAIDEVNYEIKTSTLDLLLDNTGSNPVILTGANLTRDDGAIPVETSTSSSLFLFPDKAYIANSDVLNRNIINTQALVISKK